MKTKKNGGIAIVAIALAVAFNVSLNTSKTKNASVLALANVEALASEGGVEPNVCYNCKMKDYKNKNGVIYKPCPHGYSLFVGKS